MSTLAEEQCAACRPDSAAVSDADADVLLKDLPGWEIHAVDDIPHLVRTYRFDDFVNAMNFTVATGDLAEQENHHPTLITAWGRVTVHWWTHAINGLHRNDFIMAARTDKLFSRFR